MQGTDTSSHAAIAPSGAIPGTGGQTSAVTVYAATADEMKRVGAGLARFLRPGDTVLLGGELGAGKTTLTQGLVAALGVCEPVTSPTFVLVHSYKTAAGWDLLHADVWRLEHLQEVIDLALPELLEDGAAAVIEWGELAAPALAPDWLRVSITYETGASDVPVASTVGASSNDNDEPVERSRTSVPAATGGRRLVFQALGPTWQDRLVELSRSWAATTSPEPSR